MNTHAARSAESSNANHTATDRSPVAFQTASVHKAIPAKDNAKNAEEPTITREEAIRLAMARTG